MRRRTTTFGGLVVESGWSLQLARPVRCAISASRKRLVVDVPADLQHAAWHIELSAPADVIRTGTRSGRDVLFFGETVVVPDDPDEAARAITRAGFALTLRPVDLGLPMATSAYVEEEPGRPSGWTLAGDIGGLLAPYCDDADDIEAEVRTWQGVPPLVALGIVGSMPDDEVDARHEGAPSLRTGADLLRSHGGWIEGYWVLPPRADERIALTAIALPAAVAESMARHLSPDEAHELDGGLVRLWWD